MFSVLNSKLLSIGAASIIAVGVIGAASVALADSPSAGGASSDQAAGGARDGGHGDFGRLVAGKILKDAGVTKDELKQGGSEGKTLGEIITAYGDKPVANVKTDALTALYTRLAAAVTSGKLTQLKADKLKSEAPAAFDKLMASKPGEHGKSGQGHQKLATLGKNALKTVAGILAMEPKALVDQLKTGKTIAEIAGAKTGEVTTALTTQANAAIDKAVADGKLPADKAAEAKTKAAEHIAKFVNEAHHGHADGERGEGPKPGRGGKPPKAN